MEIKIKQKKLTPQAHSLPPQGLHQVCFWPQARGCRGECLSPKPFRSPLRNRLGAPAEIRWTEGNLKGIFINFINTGAEQKQDSFIDLNIKITCAFFAFSLR